MTAAQLGVSSPGIARPSVAVSVGWSGFSIEGREWPGRVGQDEDGDADTAYLAGPGGPLSQKWEP